MCRCSLSLPGLYVTVVEVCKWKGEWQVDAPGQVCFTATGGGGVTWSMFVWMLNTQTSHRFSI